MLGDEDVRRWFDNLAAKSLLTVMLHLRNLGLYCELNNADPKAFLGRLALRGFVIASLTLLGVWSVRVRLAHTLPSLA